MKNKTPKVACLVLSFLTIFLNIKNVLKKSYLIAEKSELHNSYYNLAFLYVLAISAQLMGYNG